MKIVQLSDIHICEEGKLAHGVDVRNRFVRIINHLKTFDFDLLVISGDLCFHEGKNVIYFWILEVLQDLGKPTKIIAGNHDDSVLIGEVFNLPVTNNELYYRYDAEAKALLFLDTSLAAMSSKQWNWYESQLNELSGEAVIFMHHPPFFAGVPHMDAKYYFRESQRFLDYAATFNGRLHVYCGHYHVAKTIVKNNICLSIAPSPFFHIDPERDLFIIENHLAAFQVITIEGDCISHRTKYFEHSFFE